MTGATAVASYFNGYTNQLGDLVMCGNIETLALNSLASIINHSGVS